MNTLTNTTIHTDGGFVVTVRADRRGWSCTCGQSANAIGGARLRVDHDDHVAQHDAEIDVLHVMGTRHPMFIDALIDALGDAVVDSLQWTETSDHNSASRMMTHHHANIVIDPTRMTHAAAQGLARGRGFSARFRRRGVEMRMVES